MGLRRDKKAAWAAWQSLSYARAKTRWDRERELSRDRLACETGDACRRAIQHHLALLHDVGILRPGEAQRVKELDFGSLAGSDQTRLQRTRRPQDYTVLGLTGRPPEQKLIERSLQLNDGHRLAGGSLSLQVIVHEKARRVVAMNLQLRGFDRRRNGRKTFQRYDLDFEQMGDGPVTHFNAHWHTGDDPDDSLAEEDPRLPAVILHPTEVIEIFVETWFPRGPDDVE